MGVGRSTVMSLSFAALGASFKATPLRSMQRPMRLISSQVSTAALTIPPTRWVDRYGVVVDKPQKVNNETLKIVSYNILGAKHGESDKHFYAPGHVTNWAQRKQKLVQEIAQLDADILCLQEVTELGIRSTFLPKLAKMGLTCAGFSLAKDDRQQGPSKLAQQQSGYDNWTLGCAVFCKSSLVDVVASKRVYLKDFMPEIQNSPNLLNDVQLKDNTMVMVLLRLKGSGQHLLVANTHLFWDPQRADIKSLQTYAAARAIERMAASYKLGGSKPLATVFCGDLNAMPLRVGASIGNDDDYFSYNQGGESDQATAEHRRSGVHELLTTGTLSDQHPEHPDSWYQHVLSISNSPQLGPLKIAAPLMNTFCSKEFAPYAPAFTTKTNEFQGWLDHIWVNDQVSVTHNLVPPVCRKHPRAAELSHQYPPLPNEIHPSDHIPIGAVLTLR